MGKQAASAKQDKEKEVQEMKPVLIVEDEAIMRESLRDWLKDGGYEVETAEEGEEALEKIGKKEFSIAVLDLRLPGKDGLQVLKEATAQDPKIKGIIITAYPTVETAVEAMKIGAADYIVKPFTPDALEKAIQEVLGPLQVEVKPIPVTEVPEPEAKVAVAEPEAEIAVAEPKPEATIAEPAVVEKAEVKEVEKVRNLVFTKFHPLCRLCHYAGMSDYCALFETGTCAYQEALGESKRLQEQLCKLCQLSGFSEPCALFETGKCTYYEALEESKRLQEK
jgi:DNA-binding response OmpR family regulator